MSIDKCGLIGGPLSNEDPPMTAPTVADWIEDHARADYEERCNSGTVPIHWNSIEDSELWQAAALLREAREAENVMRMACLLTIEAAGGSMNHDDHRLAAFCDDRSTLSKPDVFNQCHERDWLISRHDDRTDSSTVYLTDNGRRRLASVHDKLGDGK